MEKTSRPVNYSAINVRELRKQAGLSRQAVVDRLAAYEVPLHTTSLRRIEEGEQAVKIEEAQAFAAIFQVDLADFITKPVNPTIAKMEQSIIHYREQLKALNSQLLAVVEAWNQIVEESDYDQLTREELRSERVQAANALAGRASGLLPLIFNLNAALGALGVDNKWRELPDRVIEARESPLTIAFSEDLIKEGSDGGES